MLNASSSIDSSHSDSLSQFVQTTFSYNGNIMLVAIISLLFVILFVLLLHLYAKWFLSQARRRSRNPISISHLLSSQFLPFTYDDGVDARFPDCATKGLDASVVASLPVFVHKSSFVDTEQPGEGLLECVICLSVFEDNDIGKNLPRCGHAFHVECVDTWLHSHSSCPICRAPVDLVSQKKKVHKEDEAAANRIENADVISTQLNRGELLFETHMTGDDDDSRTQTTVIEMRERPAEQNECVSASAASSSSQSALMLGYSLKRMLSRNRSEHKVFPPTVSNLNLHP